MATKANINIDQGTDFSTEIDLSDEAGNPLSLDQYSGKAQIRRWYTSANAVDFGVQLETGKIYLTMNSATTSSLDKERYVYDVILIDQHDVVTRVVEGLVQVNPRVTEP
jgi:hypothetical protein